MSTIERSQLLDDIVLHEDDLSEEAKNCFKYHKQVLRAFEMYRLSILRDVDLTPVGRHLFFSSIDKLHKTFKQVLNYVTENNAILNVSLPVNGPLVVCGLPRTGTTLLHNLLACDPDCRTTLLTEMFIEPVPPIPRSDLVEQERRTMVPELAEQQLVPQADSAVETSASHPRFAIEEDHHILQHAGLFSLYGLVNFDDQPDHYAWFREELNKDFAYDYHKMFLRMLNSVGAPQSHWLLKAHLHIFFLDTLLHHYPQAKLIMTHRRLDEIFPSFCRLVWAYCDRHLDPTNSNSRDTLMKKTIYHLNKAIEYLVEYRTRKKHLNDLSNKNTTMVK